MKKAIVFVFFYGILLLIAFLYRESLLEWLNRGDMTQLPLMFLLGVFFGVVPVVPFSVFAGLMGAKYGVWIGACINWVGSVGASAIFFMLSRHFFVTRFQSYISRFNGIRKFDRIISQNAFIAVLFSRIVPIVPPPVVNIYSGLSMMPFKTYLAATMIGKIPGMVAYAYLGSQLVAPRSSLLAGITLYAGFLTFVLLLYRWWYKSKAKVVLPK
ncbi:SNARE associated protein [Mesobacillus campisalis]|uniref:TVP38/TMEM64 family membrane protein n=1 Tax=Mesobacillus campisalis TaxID=1408103 RepID=A0A0M2SL59_9BACI|nr:VTT domain-containing protein [Mesobacillus campisalis]KKK33612.1 SNARE associated protein [Mesobacillus campisalis]